MRKTVKYVDTWWYSDVVQHLRENYILSEESVEVVAQHVYDVLPVKFHRRTAENIKPNGVDDLFTAAIKTAMHRYAAMRKYSIPEWAYDVEDLSTLFVRPSRPRPDDPMDDSSSAVTHAINDMGEHVMYFGSRMYLIRQEVTEALSHTNAENIGFSDVNFPFDSFILAMPKGYSIRDKKRGMGRITKIVVDRGFGQPPLQKIDTPRGDRDYIVATVLYYFDKEGPGSGRQLFQRLRWDGLENGEEEPPYYTEFDRRVRNLLVNVLAYITSTNDVIPEATAKRVSNRGKVTKSTLRVGGKVVYVPCIIGDGYVRRQKRKAGTGVTGTGRNVTLHWRAGHLRKQPVGPKDDRRIKIIWIEPMQVGAGRD